MLDLKEAVSKSLTVLKETFAVPEETQVELEEAKRQEEPDQWLMTFSYPDTTISETHDSMGPNLRAVLTKRRAYKEVRIRALDGAVMGVRNLHL